MKWYEGGIADAVMLSRQNNSIFVVYIEGKDESSNKLSKILDDAKVCSMLETSKFVAIKVEADSVPHQQFSELYNQTPIPSIYFIGKHGTLLQIVTNAKDATTLATQINEILVKGGESPIEVKTETLMQSEAAASNVVCEGDVCSIKPSEEPTAAASTSEETSAEEINNLSVEEKLKLAQDLIEKKRAMKKVEEEETQRQKEMERRKMGQDVQKMKRWQQDQEIKQRMEEREREKREEKEARDKVRRQIEEDKREKAARMTAPQPAPTNVTQRRVRPTDSNSARLQFRLPDGSSHTHDFAATVPLQEVITFIKENINLGFSNFVLSTTFPRREFKPEEANESLLSLELVPNAVILVLPVSHGAVATNNSSAVSIFWQVLAPLFTIWNYLKSLLFKDPPRHNNGNNTARPSTSGEGQEEQKPPSKKRMGESVIKRHGNVHRLSDRDSEDENNTWNGNSTQQM